MARSARTDCGRLDLGDASRLAILVLDHVHRVRIQRAGLYLHHSLLLHRRLFQQRRHPFHHLEAALVPYLHYFLL